MARQGPKKKALGGSEARQGLEQAAEKGVTGLKQSANRPPAAKAVLTTGGLAARMNPCPFKTARRLSFSAACKTRR
jgi:hypothetical protein